MRKFPRIFHLRKKYFSINVANLSFIVVSPMKNVPKETTRYSSTYWSHALSTSLLYSLLSLIVCLREISHFGVFQTFPSKPVTYLSLHVIPSRHQDGPRISVRLLRRRNRRESEGGPPFHGVPEEYYIRCCCEVSRG